MRLSLGIGGFGAGGATAVCGRPWAAGYQGVDPGAETPLEMAVGR